MSPLPAAFKLEMQKEYAATFDQKLAGLNGALKASDATQLKTIFHQLAGSGQTYDMPEITRIARQAENLLFSSFDFKAISALIEEIAKVFSEEKNKIDQN